MNAAVGFLLVCIVLLGAITCRAEEAGSAGGTITGHRPAGAILTQATPRYYDEQRLNYVYSEFCASVKKPPAGLIESIDAAFEKDKSVGEIWLWIHDIAEKIRTRCGDA
jgi:hypothetical protein